MAKIQSFFGNGRAVLLGKCSPAFGFSPDQKEIGRYRLNQVYFLTVGGFGIIAPGPGS